MQELQVDPAYCMDTPATHPAAPGWRASLVLIERHMPFARRTLHAGERVQIAGDVFACLHVVFLGAVKTMAPSRNGRERIAGLHLKGDWIGFDSFATGRCASDAYALDTSEIWSLGQVALLGAAARVPELMQAVLGAMGSQLVRDRERRFALGILPADARVADFVCYWAQALAACDLRSDHITLPMTRSEIGSYLGVALETVSRAFSRLAEAGLIRFDDKDRRYVGIPSVPALLGFVDGTARLQPER